MQNLCQPAWLDLALTVTREGKNRVCGDDVEILVGADGRESVIGLRLSWRSEASSTNVAGALVGWIGGYPGLEMLPCSGTYCLSLLP
ncbi:Fatty acid hydroxylase vlmA [Fusarium oxysporum f. sp. albedinis]|nr:Fatty acid hydroxylase vlmA [Fusarium oxysporum f. sp. albedinis]